MIFYSDHLLHEKDLTNNCIGIDIQKPYDFYKKLINLQDHDINLITSNAFEFYKKRCSLESFKKTYVDVIKLFLTNKSQWK